MRKGNPGFKMLGYSTTLINLTEGNKKNLFNFPRLKTHQSLTIPFLPKLTGTSTSASMSQPPPRHPRTHPSSKLLLCTEVMITRRGWQRLGSWAAIARDVNAPLGTLNLLDTPNVTCMPSHCAGDQTTERPTNPKSTHRGTQVSFGKTDIRKNKHTRATLSF